MKRKIISFILAAVMVLSLAPLAFAEGMELVIVKPDTLPKAGDTFSVRLEVKNNPGMNSFGFTLSFDKEAVDCDKMWAGEVVQGTLYVTNANASEGAMITGASIDAIGDDGVIANYTFKALKDLTSLDFELSGSASYSPIDNPKENVDVAFTVKTETAAGMILESAPDDTPDVTPPVIIIPDPTPEKTAFSDIENHWAKENIEKAAGLKLFNGYTDGTFKPDVNVTRAQFVTVLYRNAGSPAVTATSKFEDISTQSEEFRSAIEWAYSTGLVNGRSETVFAPNDPLSRQEAVKILYNLAGGMPGLEIMFYTAYEAQFKDHAEISSWAKSPMYWAVYKGLINGTSSTTLSPRTYVTRAQLATILVKYNDLFGGAGE